MESERQRIQRMMSEEKINSRQAELLLSALEESEKKKEKIFQDISIHKKKRNKEMWRILGIWCLVVLFLAGSFIYLGKREVIGRDTAKALKHFSEASFYLEKENYREAIRYCQKGIDQASRFPLGYSLMGAAYKLLYQQNHDASIKEKAKAAFRKADRLKGSLNRRQKMNGVAILFTFILLILILGAISIILLFIYNTLVRREEGVNQTWAQIEAQYQRKLDLVPALLEAVKDYAAHENQTHQAVTQARAKAQGAIESIGGVALSSKEKLKELLQSQGELSLRLGKLFALVEKYPDLKASDNFLTIQKQLEETEDRIATTRGMYNRSVKSYNAFLRSFPGNLAAALFKFEPKAYFEREGGAA